MRIFCSGLDATLSSGLNRVLALSFWKTREDAERYQREQYNSVRDALQPLLEAEPVVRTFEVHSSTGHKITASKAA